MPFVHLSLNKCDAVCLTDIPVVVCEQRVSASVWRITYRSHRINYKNINKINFMCAITQSARSSFIRTLTGCATQIKFNLSSETDASSASTRPMCSYFSSLWAVQWLRLRFPRLSISWSVNSENWNAFVAARTHSHARSPRAEQTKYKQIHLIRSLKVSGLSLDSVFIYQILSSSTHTLDLSRRGKQRNWKK